MQIHKYTNIFLLPGHMKPFKSIMIHFFTLFGSVNKIYLFALKGSKPDEHRQRGCTVYLGALGKQEHGHCTTRRPGWWA